MTPARSAQSRETIYSRASCHPSFRLGSPTCQSGPSRRSYASSVNDATFFKVSRETSHKRCLAEVPIQASRRSRLTMKWVGELIFKNPTCSKPEAPLGIEPSLERSCCFTTHRRRFDVLTISCTPTYRKCILCCSARPQSATPNSNNRTSLGWFRRTVRLGQSDHSHSLRSPEHS